MIEIEYIDGGTHGSHWSSVIPDKNFFIDFLYSSHMKLVHAFMSDDARLCAYSRKLSKNLFCTVIKRDSEILTAYPTLKTEKFIELEVEKILEWKGGFQAYIQGVSGDALITAFASDYFMRKKDYIDGEVNKASLSMIAYNQKIEPWKGKTAEIDGKIMDIGDAEILVPLSKVHRYAHPDDYRVHGKILKIEKITILGKIFHLSRIQCYPVNEIDVLCLNENSNGTPEENKMLGVIGWMQMRLYDE